MMHPGSPSADPVISQSFGAKQMCSLARVPYSTLNYWARTGVLEPSVMSASGRGTDRLWNFQDLIAARVAGTLRGAGISLQAIRKVIDSLRTEYRLDRPLAEARLVVVGNDVAIARDDDELVSVLRQPGQAYLAFVVDVAHVVDELRTEIVRMAA